MPKFLTIGYGDEAGYDRTPAPIRDAAHDHDERLREAGAIVGTAGAPVQVRNPEGHEDAIDQVAQTPCAVAYGVVEIWPLWAGR
jgi:hypothetical protein